MAKINDEKEQERLGKIVMLARHGVGGEKENALRMVRSLCAKHGLEFEDVMAESESEKEFYIDHPRRCARLLMHIVIRYAYDGDATGDGLGQSRDLKRVYFTTTASRYIEVVQAFSVLDRLYKKEQRRMRAALFYGFLTKHNLFADKVPKPKKSRDIGEEEMRAREMGSSLAKGMEDAQIHKALPRGKK